MPMPALLMTASSRPKRATADATASWHPASFERSAMIGWRRSDPGKRASAVASRSTAATLWPAAISALVIAEPIPPAPVTNTTLSAMSLHLDAGRFDDRLPALHLGSEMRGKLARRGADDGRTQLRVALLHSRIMQGRNRVGIELCDNLRRRLRRREQREP